MPTTLKTPVRDGRADRTTWDVGVAPGEGSAAQALLDEVSDPQRPLPPVRPNGNRPFRPPAPPSHFTRILPGLEIAAGILLGLTASKAVTAFVNDILLPPVGQLLGGVNFPDLFLLLDKSKGECASLARARDAGLPVLAYGEFIGTALDLLIVAACVLVALQWVRAVRRQPLASATPPATIKTCLYCCSAIPIRATRCPFCTSLVK